MTSADDEAAQGPTPVPTGRWAKLGQRVDDWAKDSETRQARAKKLTRWLLYTVVTGLLFIFGHATKDLAAASAIVALAGAGEMVFDQRHKIGEATWTFDLLVSSCAIVAVFSAFEYGELEAGGKAPIAPGWLFAMSLILGASAVYFSVSKRR
jgi:hypothetical protein